MTRQATRLLLLLAPVVLVVSALVVSAEWPDPRAGASMPTREQNLDPNGYLAVHEQGIADVTVRGGQLDANITNSSLQVTGAVEVTNLPPVQDVNIVNSQVEVRHPPVTVAEGSNIGAEAGASTTITFDQTINATTVSVSFRGATEAIVSVITPFAAEIRISNDNGIEQTHVMSFTYPIQVTAVKMECLNESDYCAGFYSVFGFEAD